MHDSLSQFARDLVVAIRRMPPQNSSTDEAWFEDQAWRLCRLQAESNPVYRAAALPWPSQNGDWRGIPSVPASAFKEWDVTSLAPMDRARVFCSSGTTGQTPGRHHHSPESLAVYEESLWAWFRPHLLPESLPAPTCWLCLTPPADQAPQSSLAHMMETAARRWRHGGGAPAGPMSLGQVDADGTWQVPGGPVVEALTAATDAGSPVLLMGTAFNFVHLLDRMIADGVRMVLPAGSRVMETGGYKGRSRSMSRGQLHDVITGRLGIAPEFIVSEYGMSELSSQAYDGVAGCPAAARIFQLPPWARALVVSPETGREVPERGTGLLRLLDLANVWSVAAVQTADLAVRRGGGFELLGRAPAAEARGCSLRSADGD